MMQTDETIIVLADASDEAQIHLLRQKLPGVQIVAGSSTVEFADVAERATVLSYWSGTRALLREVFGMCPKLRWVHSRSVGLDRMLFPELQASGVTLTNGSGVFSAALGEFVVGAILFFAKDFRRLVRNQTAAVWEQFDVERAAGKIIGIVGYGDIGRAIAVRARALEMAVLGVKRHVVQAETADGPAERLFSPEQRLEMIAQCDYVAVAAPLTAETRGMIGKQEIAAMKPNAVLINVGRGPLIDEDELVRALTENRIRGAALDVFNQEPLPPGHPFYKLENVLLSPHSADHTVDWLHNSTLFFAEQFRHYTRGEKLQNVVDKALGY